MVTNDFLPFCPTDTGTNLESQADYAVDANRTDGNQPGVASSKLNNKALRQGTYIASQVAQYISNTLNEDVLDDATPAKLLAQLNAALKFYAPIVTKYGTGSTNFHQTYYFQIASGNATSGATYTNNGITYTVVTTISGGTELRTTGTGAPTVSGTLTKTGGTGDSTLTFYAVRSAIYLIVDGRAGGGGGQGSSNFATGGGGTGGNGNTTSFGSSLLTATGGTGGAGPGGSNAGSPGGVTVNSPAIDIASVPGGYGGGNFAAVATGMFVPGGTGGASSAGGNGGQGAGQNGSGENGVDGTGAGGGGAGSPSAGIAGVAGSSGGRFVAMITSPTGSYAVVVGTGGAAGAAGTGSTLTGGKGGDGGMTVIEHFQ